MLRGTICSTIFQGIVRSALIEPELLTPVGNEESGIKKLQQLVEDVSKCGEGRARLRRVLDRAAKMPRLPAEVKVSDNRVMGCTSQVVTDLFLKPNVTLSAFCKSCPLDSLLLLSSFPSICRFLRSVTYFW